ncbi:hypothetical protein Sste5346_002601 [Sporothrix stenoceras]|uniref:Uncharacterized protein n=1 Tax=Sporothrix stenoceras TaxID=5173 RepID=A0ABR3ZIP2_9PEZI
MGLADSVDALLDTYAKCLSLLRVFSSSSKESSAYANGQYAPSSDWERQSELGRSLQSDRAKIQKVYSTRLSETGGRLQKGDGQSRSALRRIVRRLTDALASALGFGSSRKDSAMPDGQRLLNYDALRALSNASRIDAIHVIDEASVRMGGHRHRSSQSTVSGRSRSSRASSGRGLPSSSTPKASSPRSSKSTSSLDDRQRHTQQGSKHHRAPGSSSGSSHGYRISTKRDSSKTGNSSRPGAPKPKHTKKSSSSLRETASQTQPAPSSGKQKKRSSSHHRDSSRSTASARRSDSGSTVVRYTSTSQNDSGNRLGRRVSMVSRSSGSTKLGEIPEHKLRRRPMPAGSGSGDNIWDIEAPGYNIRPAYPMRPFCEADKPETEKPKKRFWGVFSRS